MIRDDPTISPPSEEVWTTRRLLGWMVPHFESKDVESPRIVAEMLLAHVLECDRMRLYMEVDRPASLEEREMLRELVARAARHEPVQYLVGEGMFYGRSFVVDPSTLIPRPSTEAVVDAVLEWGEQSERQSRPLIADIGTGTGCIAITLALQWPEARLIATDVAETALSLARRNAERHGVADRIEFRTGSLLEALGCDGEAFDVIASNPPYIPDHEWGDIAANVKNYEPASALRGGRDGLDFLRPLIASAPARLAPGGLLALEIADCRRDEAIALAEATGMLEGIEVLRDHEQLNRVLRAVRTADQISSPRPG